MQEMQRNFTDFKAALGSPRPKSCRSRALHGRFLARRTPGLITGAVQKLRCRGKIKHGPGPELEQWPGWRPAEAMGARELALRISIPHGAGPPSLEPPDPDGADRDGVRGGRARAQGPSPHPRAAPPSSAPSAGGPPHAPDAPRTWFPPVSELSLWGAAPNRPGVCLFFSEILRGAPHARRGQCVNSVPRPKIGLNGQN